MIVIGGGPAGLFCAAEVAGSGHGVLLLEKMLSCGRKLLVTGSGQCNLTHDGDIRDFFKKYGDHGAFLRSPLRKFSNHDLMAWFTSRDLPLAPDESGKIFPKSRKAADVLSVLLAECRKNGVVIQYGEAVKEVRRSDTKFHVRTGTAEYESGALVIAMAWSAAGGRRLWAWAALVLGIAGALFLALLNQADGRLATLRGQPVVGRFAEIARTTEGSQAVRLSIWSGVDRLLVGQPPARLAVGSGPETLTYALLP